MSRKVGQPYDDVVFDTRDEAVKYIKDNYVDKIPEGVTAEQVVYDYIHRKNPKRGICAIPTCNNKTEWNVETKKYRQICDNPKCISSRRDNYLKNIQKTYGTTNLMADPEFNREKLMNNRRNGTYYMWSDKSGSRRVFSMVEYRILEYLDTILQYKFDDVITQEPIIEYKDHEGKNHFHVPDIFIKSLNLIVSAKDGLDNPNRSPHFRKDRLKNLVIYQHILNNTKYNYVQIEGDKDINGLGNATKEVSAMYKRGGRYVMPPRIDFFLLGETEYIEDVSVSFKNIVTFFRPHTRDVMCMFFAIDVIKDTLLYTYDGGVIKAVNADKLYEAYDMDYLVLREPIDIVGMTAHSVGSNTIFKGDTTSLIRFMMCDNNTEFSKFYAEFVTDDKVNLGISHLNTTRDDIVQTYHNKLSDLFMDSDEHSLIASNDSQRDKFVSDNFETNVDIDGNIRMGLYSESNRADSLFKDIANWVTGSLTMNKVPSYDKSNTIPRSTVTKNIKRIECNFVEICDAFRKDILSDSSMRSFIDDKMFPRKSSYSLSYYDDSSPYSKLTDSTSNSVIYFTEERDDVCVIDCVVMSVYTWDLYPNKNARDDEVIKECMTTLYNKLSVVVNKLHGNLAIDIRPILTGDTDEYVLVLRSVPIDLNNKAVK